MKKYFSQFAFICCVLGLVACSNPESMSFDNVRLYEPARKINQFQLQDSESKTFNLESLSNHWSILFLGYTYCPDICPTTLNDLNRIYPELKQLNVNAQIVFISADPQRDTTEQLKQYIEFFNSEFKAITSSHKQLLPFTRELGLVYSMQGEGDNYLVNHSASLVVVNPKGELAASIKPNFKQSPPKIDFEQVVDLIKFLAKTD